jgi:hypothetical protein
MVVGPAQPHIQWVPGALSLEVKRTRREADHSPPSNEELLARRPTPKLEDHPLSAIRNCLFSVFATTFHIWKLYPPSSRESVKYKLGLVAVREVTLVEVGSWPEGKKPLGRTTRRWEIRWKDVDWMHLAQKDQWRALVNTVMNLRVP